MKAGHMTKRALLLIAALAAHGCAGTYTTPGGAVSIPAITEPEIAEALATEPAAEFPVRLVTARVQAPGYWSGTNRGYGTGTYSIVTARDIEEDGDFERLEALPGVSATASL